MKNNEMKHMKCSIRASASSYRQSVMEHTTASAAKLKDCRTVSNGVIHLSKDAGVRAKSVTECVWQGPLCWALPSAIFTDSKAAGTRFTNECDIVQSYRIERGDPDQSIHLQGFK